MKKVILILAVLFLLVIVAAVGGLLYANHYVQSTSFKERLVAEISKVTGGTVKIETINVGLTSRVEVGGIKLDKSDQKTGSQAFSTKNILVRFNFWALLHKKIEIQELILESPDIKIVSAPKQAPAPTPVPSQTPPPAPGEVAPQPPSTAEAPTTQSPSTEIPKTQPPATTPAKTPIDLVIQKAEVRNGKLDITLPNGKRIVLENFNLKSTIQQSDPLKLNGEATCEKVIIDTQPPLTDFKSTFRFDNNTLFIEKAKAVAFRGTIDIDGQAKVDGNQPFTLRVKCSNVDLKALLEQKPQLSQAISGNANANVDVAGNFESPLDATGKGFAEVKDGIITTKPIQFLMFTYQIPELQVITLSKCETDFTIGARKVQFSRMEALSPNVRFDATGWYDLETSTIDFNLHPSISDAVKGRLPPAVTAGLQPETDGFSSIAFHAWGPVDNPQNDLKSKFAEGVVDNFLTTQIPQNIINNTFDTLEGMIKNPTNADTNSTNSGSILDNILGDRGNPSPTTNAAPADASTNAPPEKELLNKLKKLF